MNKVVPVKIDFSQKNSIEKIRKRYNHNAAIHCFNNIAIWEHDLGLTLYKNDSLYTVKSDLMGENCWFFPCGENDEKRTLIRELIDEAKEKNGQLELVFMTEEDKLFLEREFPEEFAITYSRNDSEYLLSRQEQLGMHGKKFHSLRNQINQVVNKYDIEMRNIYDEPKENLMEIVKLWAEHKNHAEWIDDSVACRFTIEHLEKLGGMGQVFYLDGSPFGVVFGFPINDDTYDFVMSKLEKTIPGMGAYIKHEFFKKIPEQYSLINIEDDMGIEGLRNMKTLFRPVGFVDMYRGRLIR